MEKMDRFTETRVSTMLSRPVKSNKTFFSPLTLKDEQTMEYADFS